MAGNRCLGKHMSGDENKRLSDNYQEGSPGASENKMRRANKPLMKILMHLYNSKAV